MIGECWATVVFGDDILDICYWLEEVPMDTAADIVAQLCYAPTAMASRRGLPLARRQRGDTGEQPRHRLRIFDSAYRKGALSRILDRGADVVGLGAAESLQVDHTRRQAESFPARGGR